MKNKQFSTLVLTFLVLIPAFFFSQTAHAVIYSSLTIGSRGAQVTELQKTLTNLGFYSGPVTGYFGNLTRSAVVKFQMANNIIPSVGYFGPLSRVKLNQLTQDKAIIQPFQSVNIVQPSLVSQQGNIFFVEDNGSLIESKTIESDRGLIHLSDAVNREKVLKILFQKYPEVAQKYDFVIITTNFSGLVNDLTNERGQFVALKQYIKGVSDRFGTDRDAISQLNSSVGLNGSERIQGYIWMPDFNSQTDPKGLLLHEISHRWLFYLGDAEEACGKAFGCTRETGYKVNSDGGHYGGKVKTSGVVSDKISIDPNGGSTLFTGADGSCQGGGVVPTEYRFTSLSLYLMGLIPMEETQPLKWSEYGEAINGVLLCIGKQLTVQEVINMVGLRIPAYPNAQRDFTVAHVLLTKKGERATDSQIQKLNLLNQLLAGWWADATNNKSTINK